MGNRKGEETTGDSQPAIASPGAPNPRALAWVSGSRVKALLATVRLRGARGYLLPLEGKGSRVLFTQNQVFHLREGLERWGWG